MLLCHVGSEHLRQQSKPGRNPSHIIGAQTWAGIWHQTWGLATCNMLWGEFSSCVNLAAVRLTPRLQTKTNYILASQMVADLWAGFEVIETAAVTGIVTFDGGQCKYSILVAINWTFQKLPSFGGMLSLLVVGIDRYVAIIYPLAYEARMTFSVIKRMIVVAWVVTWIYAASFWFWLINADARWCSVVPAKYQSLDVAMIMSISVSLAFIYSCILREALRHSVQVYPQSTGNYHSQVPVPASSMTSRLVQAEITLGVVLHIHGRIHVCC